MMESIKIAQETSISDMQEKIVASLLKNETVQENLRTGSGGDVALLLIEQKLAEFGVTELEPAKITEVVNFMDTAERAVRYRISKRQYNTIVDEIYLRLAACLG